MIEIIAYITIAIILSSITAILTLMSEQVVIKVVENKLVNKILSWLLLLPLFDNFVDKFENFLNKIELVVGKMKLIPLLLKHAWSITVFILKILTALTSLIIIYKIFF